MDINTQNTHELLESASESTRCAVAGYVQLFQSIKWVSVDIAIMMTPKPAARPRLSGFRIYVPNAEKNATFFNNNVLPTLEGLFISTPCNVCLDIYQETPKSFTKVQKCLAEMRVMKPWTHTKDIDNYEKAVYDMIQPNAKRGHDGILANDGLIIETHARKFYSLTPRYELKVSYMNKIPPDIIKVLKIIEEMSDINE